MKTTLKFAVLMVSLMIAGMSNAEIDNSQDDARYQSTLMNIAEAIERLKVEYPQLADFSARHHCDLDEQTIEYGFRTHDDLSMSGWRGAVPSPDDDGVWFHIDFHDPDSQRMIHTQPVVQRYRYLNKHVQFLFLEGEATQKIREAVLKIIREHGVGSNDGGQE